MMRTPTPKEDKEAKKVTFTAKEPISCPICDTAFRREELFQGRVNAGDLTDELHRLYTPMAAYGVVMPLVYDVTVCPSCYYAAFKGDFPAVTSKFREKLVDEMEYRIKSSQTLFASLDFQSPRRIEEGTASYLLAMLCYEHFTKEFSPTTKMAMCSLRAAWLFGHMHERYPGQNYDYVATMFHKKALFLYKQTIEYEQKKMESVSTVKYLGPDTDKNYAYEGVLYLCGVLEMKYGQREDPERRNLELDRSKRAIARMFGLGKKTKSKPGPLLEKARNLYDELKRELNADDDEDDGEE